MYKNRNL
jgi:hypothetical protein